MVTDTSDAALYEAFKSRDARFDGRFFVGVSSTGIYCRPACHAKMPKPENCTFYASAAEAELAGYRPCMICRPELAPGRAIVDARSSLARRAAKLLEESCNSRASMETLAGKLGCTSRHLRRVFEEVHRVTPKQYVQTCRLLLAKSLLTDTRLSMAQIATAAGFGSVRAFNDAFRLHYRMPPSRLRKQVEEGGADAASGATRDVSSDAAKGASPDATMVPSSDVALYLGYQPPYAWEELLAELALLAESGVSEVADGRYRRLLHLREAGEGGAKHVGWIEVSNVPAKSRLRLNVSPELLPVLPQVLASVRRMFDTACDPDAIASSLVAHALAGAPYTPGTRLVGGAPFPDDGVDGDALMWPDTPCEDDPAVIAAMPGATRAERLLKTQAWSPWRSYYVASLRQRACLLEAASP